MSPLENIQMALVSLAQHLCLERKCGCEGAGQAGKRQRPIRCSECPLDCADPVWDDFARKDTP